MFLTLAGCDDKATRSFFKREGKAKFPPLHNLLFVHIQKVGVTRGNRFHKGKNPCQSEIFLLGFSNSLAKTFFGLVPAPFVPGIALVNASHYVLPQDGLGIEKVYRVDKRPCNLLDYIR